MRKQLLDRLRDPGAERKSALLCLTVCFTVGAAGGCVFASLLGPDTQMRLLDYFSSYFSALEATETAHPSFVAIAWEVVRWPLLAFLLGFTALGVVGLPVAFCVRGFLLSYAVAVLVRLYGLAGLVSALAVFGIAGFLVLPVLFTLGVDAFRCAGALTGKLLGVSRRTTVPQADRFARAGACCAVLAAGVALQSRLSPALLAAAAGLLN